MKNNKEYFYMLTNYQSDIKWIPAEVGELFFWQDDLYEKNTLQIKLRSSVSIYRQSNDDDDDVAETHFPC